MSEILCIDTYISAQFQLLSRKIDIDQKFPLGPIYRVDLRHSYSSYTINIVNEFYISMTY